MQFFKLSTLILHSIIARSTFAGVIIYSTEPIVITSGNIIAKDGEIDLESLAFSDRYKMPLIGELEDGQDRILIASEKSLVIAKGCSIDANGDILISANTNKSEKIKEVILHPRTSHIKGNKVSVHSKGNIETKDNISIDPNNGSVAIAGKLISNGNISIQKLTIGESLIEQLSN